MSGGDGDDRRDWDSVAFDANTPPAEWVLAGIGAVFAVLIIGLLAVYAVRNPDTPPELAADAVEVIDRGGPYLVAGELTNTGGASASNVTVEGALVVDGREVEAAEVVVDYVPAGVTEEFFLVFDRDPRRGRVELRPTGFIEH